jgi:hypothetical protein
MEEEKGFLHGFIQFVKYTLIALLAWFVIGAGWNGWYEWYSREVQKKVPNEKSGERFGNKVFVGWLASFIIECIILSETNYPEAAFKAIVLINIIFITLSILGLIYFFKKCL